MNKFSIESIPIADNSKPVLYKIYLGNRYYLHKGKTLQESAERFLEDVFRGMRGKSCPESYSNAVEYCNLHPQIYKAVLELVLNADPDKILRKETALYKSMKNDDESLNRLDIEPYKPEWMLKQAIGKRCDKEACIKSGIIEGKGKSFRFCPNCGRLNK